MNPGRSVLFGTVLAAGALAGACLPARERTERPDLDVDRTGGQILALRPEPAAGAPVRPDQFCLPGGPVVGGAAVVDCQLVPLLVPAAERCNDARAPLAADPARLCRPIEPSLTDDVIGWAVTSTATAGSSARTGVIYRSETTVVVPGAGDSTAPGSVGSTMLQPVYRAVDGELPWSELAVCDGDVDANGTTELMVLVRSGDRARRARPEVVVVSFVGTPLETGEEAMPALQSARPVDDLGREQGQGCHSPLVSRLMRDGATLRLRDAARST